MVVGAGFIGLEMAENLHNLGIKVSIVELAPQVMPLVDFEIASEIHQHLKTKGVEFYLNDQVVSFLPEQLKIGLKLQSGREIYVDMIILSIGVKPENKLAKEAGLSLGNRGGILVNEFLQTSDENIYAVGDAIEGLNYLLNKNMIIPLAGPANKQARIAAYNMVYGNKIKYKGSIGSSVAKVFDLTVASCGLSEKQCKSENLNFNKVIIHSTSHAGYYPQDLPLTLKLIFENVTGKILGAQAIGYEGVEKRIDVISAFIQKNGTVFDLVEFEHCYAPPCSSAKDPVNLAGYVAENVINGNVKQLFWDDLINYNKDEIFLVDVRTKEEYDLGTINGAINIPVDKIRENIKLFPKDKKIVVFCGVGLRGYVAYRILVQNGYSNVYNLAGGYKTYEHVTQKQSNEDIFEKDVIGKDDMIYQLGKNDLNQNYQNAKMLELDACGLQCPGPILKLKKEFEKINDGEFVKIKASDPGFKRDVEAWSSLTNNQLLSINEEGGIITAIIQKGNQKNIETVKDIIQKRSNENFSLTKDMNNGTIIVFSNDMDKVLASFVLALGAISAGKKVTMFFTFWGLTVIKKTKKVRTKKDLMGKMFGLMLPNNANHLKLSKMNMFGLGPIFMKLRMKQKKISMIDEMLKEALESGVRFVACQMSMDVMGINKEELIDGVEIGGVATYMEAASRSNMNLFI